VLTLTAQIPRPYDEYFALYTLGSTGKAEHYFPSDVADILPNVRISWFLSVYNHMGTVQLVKVVLKLLNSTMQGPDQLAMLPSQRDAFYEKTRLLLSNETWVLPLSWSVVDANKSETRMTIFSILLNGQNLSENVEVTASHGLNFRIVVELWVYDGTSGMFEFGWLSNGTKRVVWNQLWFNMTRVSLLPY